MNSIGNENELQKANNYVDIFQISRHKWKPITEVPAIFFAKVGAAVMLNRKRLVQYPFLLDNNTMAYSFEKGVWNISFGKSLFETIDLTSLVQVGALPSYNASDVEDIKIFLPSLQEQARIGTFFRHLDHLVTLHQCNCNMATRPYEWSSGLRAIAWEQRKLGEIADKVTEKNTTLRYTEALTNSAEFGIIGQRDFFDHNVAKLSSLHGYYIVKEDDFVYNPRISVTAPVGPVNRNKLGKIGVVSPLYTVLRTAQIDNEFLEWFFKSACWHSFMIFNGDSGARSDRFSIKNSTFFEMPIPCPCRMEQVRIGAFFRHLDRLITLHQRKHILLT